MSTKMFIFLACFARFNYQMVCNIVNEASLWKVDGDARSRF